MRELLTSILQETVRAHGMRPALVEPGRSLTYLDLDTKSEKLAAAIRQSGVRPNSHIAILRNKSIETIVCIYAILKSGCTYIPLDPKSGMNKLGSILADAQPELVFTEPRFSQLLTAALSEQSVRRIAGADGDLLNIVRYESDSSSSTIQDHAGSSPSAYILYTSGTTGTPKGVEHTHASAIAFASWAAMEFEITCTDRLSCHAPLHFDLTTFDLFAALIAGAAVVLIPEQLTIFPQSVSALMESAQITIWYSVPFALAQMTEREQLAQRSLPLLREIIFAGERFPPAALQKLARAVPNARLTNLFGPTETKLSQDPAPLYVTILRLKPNMTPDATNASLQPIIEQFAKETPQHFPKDFQVNVQGLNDFVIKNLGEALYLLFGAAALLLVIGCGNVSILLLARGTVRAPEFAVRTAVGASRGRLIRQLLTESLLLATLGSLIGVLLAFCAIPMILSFLPRTSFAPEAVIQIDIPVLVVSIGLALATGVLFGLLPALKVSRTQVSSVVLRGASRGIAGSLGRRRTHNTLITAQIALTLVLMAASGDAMNGFMALMHTNLGYDPHNVMPVVVPLHENTYLNWAARSAYFAQLRAKVAEVPGVTLAAISTNATPPRNGYNTRIEISGRPSLEQQMALTNLVSHEYFSALRIPLVQGDLWTEAEERNGAHVAIVNETMARLYFPNGQAIGHSFKVPSLVGRPPILLSSPGADSWLQIIGVVADDRDDGLRNAIRPQVFLPFTLYMFEYTEILVRSEVPPLSLLHAVRAQLSSVNPNQQTLGEVEDLEHGLLDEPELQQEHLIAWLSATFAVLALALAALGLYSVMSYSVAQRKKEFGIRIALGAQRKRIVWNVVSSAFVSVGTGILTGVLSILALNKVLAALIGNNTANPLILIAAVLLLCLVAGIACAMPARRACVVDPVLNLRDD